MNRDQARELFNSQLEYSDIKSNHIAYLRDRIDEQLKDYSNNGFTMKLTKKMRHRYGLNGGVEMVEIRVKGVINNKIIHFEEREAISFNSDGFIGFAGWADGSNVQPFIKAFEMWIKKDL